MAKRRDTGCGREERAAAGLLAGRAPVEAKHLIELIRAVNPTGQDLSAVDTQRRYVLKSQLQSLLVRRFGEELSLELDSDGANVVLLRHRFLGVDACHAAIDALDEDARSWVRLHLDLGTAHPATTAPVAAAARKERRSSSGGGSDPVQLGRQALEEFDYETARAHFEGALGDPRCGLLAARSLVSMLVDTLAADPEALALEDQLSPDALADTEIRVLLALAAARGSESDRSLRLLKGVESPRSAEVLAILARDALRAGGVDESARLLALARESDAALPDLATLAAEIDAARREALRPLEDEAAAAWQRGDSATAEAQARVILERLPASTTARRIVRQAEEARRRERIQRLLSEAAQALGEKRFESAASRLREASGLGEVGLEQRIAEAEARAAAARDELWLQGACALLTRTDRERALEEFLELEPELRARALALHSGQTARWADTFLAVSSIPRASAQAAIALERALGLPTDEPQRIIDALAPHESLVERVPDGKELLATARGLLASRRGAAAREQLAACLRLLAAGDDVGALQAFAHIDRAALPGEQNAEADALSARLDQIRERRELLGEYQRLEGRGDLLGAIQALEKLDACEPANGSWRSKIAGLRGRLRREWLLKVETVEEELAQMRGWWPSGSMQEEPGLWLSAKEKLYLVRSEGRWIFIRELDLARSRVVRTAMLLAPVDMDYADVVVDGGTIWIASPKGILQLWLSTFEVARWKPIADLVSRDQIIERTMPVPGGGLVWVDARVGYDDQVTVFDCSSWRSVRRLKERFLYSVLPGDVPGVSNVKASRATIYTARGTISVTVDAGVEHRLLAVAAYPSGSGFIALAHDPDEEVPELCVVNMSEPNKRTPSLLEDSLFEAPHCLATSLSARTSFVLFDGSEGRKLAAFRDSGTGLHREYLADVDPDCMLVQDAAGRHVYMLVPSVPGVELIELGSTRPPPVAERRALVREPDPTLPSFMDCSVESPRRARSLALSGLLRSKLAGELLDWLAHFRSQHEGDPEELMDLADALIYASRYDQHKEMVEFAARHNPHNLEAAMAFGADLLVACKFGEARKVLEAVPLSEIQGEPARHYHHLLGVARLHSGDRTGAVKAWRTGVSHPGNCALDLCLAIADPDSPPLPDGAWDEKQPVRMQILGAVHAADACLAQGDIAGATAAIDRPAVHLISDVQAHARLAAALLQQEATAVLESFDKATSLAKFVHLAEEGERNKDERSSIEALVTAWPAERIADLAERAREWLKSFALEVLP